MANSTNIPTSLKITSQIPLNYKEWVKDEDTLAYLGVDDNLAFTYHEDIEIFCKAEKTLYKWREVQDGEENTGLIPLDFTYPNNLIVDDVDYSNRTFNFFKIDYFTNENFPLKNVGVGEKIYKESTEYDLKTLKSNTLSITSTENEIIIERPDELSIPQFIVNSDYTGTEELGTVQNPFKSLQNALNAYKGSGTNLSPEFSGTIITVQKDTNVFTGSLSYSELNLVLKKGTILNSNPSLGTRIMDLDSDALLPGDLLPFGDNVPVTITITIEEGAILNLEKQGFKNSGTKLNTGGFTSKFVKLYGSGGIILNNDTDISSPSIRNIIESNADNVLGFYNDGNLPTFDIRCSLRTGNTQLVKVGLNCKIYFTNTITQFNDTITSYNEDTIPFEIDGGTVLVTDSSLINYNKAGLLLNVPFVLKNNATFSARNSNIGGTCNYLFENVGTGQPALTLNNCFNDGIILTLIAKSQDVQWDNSRFINCYLYSGSLDDSQFLLKPNFINNIDSKIITTLYIYETKAEAVANGLTKGCIFRKRKTVNASDLIGGIEYEIATSGTPSLGTPGVFFTATGSETGTGTAYLDELTLI